jgi:hypothetical protein
MGALLLLQLKSGSIFQPSCASACNWSLQIPSFFPRDIDFATGIPVDSNALFRRKSVRLIANMRKQIWTPRCTYPPTPLIFSPRCRLHQSRSSDRLHNMHYALLAHFNRKKAELHSAVCTRDARSQSRSIVRRTICKVQCCIKICDSARADGVHSLHIHFLARLSQCEGPGDARVQANIDFCTVVDSLMMDGSCSSITFSLIF